MFPRMHTFGHAEPLTAVTTRKCSQVQLGTSKAEQIDSSQQINKAPARYFQWC